MCCKPGDVGYIMGNVIPVYLDSKKYHLTHDANVVGLAPRG
jgi:hypothetical protein